MLLDVKCISLSINYPNESYIWIYGQIFLGEFCHLGDQFFSKTFGGFRLSIAILTKFNVFFGNFLTSQSWKQDPYVWTKLKH
jgi:hypothetical protein